jgi:hypothetical protein
MFSIAQHIDRRFNFVKIGFLFLFLYSINAWFTWGINIFIAQILTTILIILGYNKNQFLITENKIICVVILISIKLYNVYLNDGNINAVVGSLITVIPIAFLLFYTNHIRHEILKFITKWVAVILFFSIIAWILFLIGLKWNSSSIEYNEGQYVFDNYYFFLHLKRGFLFRYNSIFLEPGQLGMIATFLLFINKFNLKRKSVLIIFIANLLTLSLASYIVMVISAFWLFAVSRRQISTGIILGILLIFSFQYFQSKRSGNILYDNIIARLQFEDGDIKGNNRFSSDMDRYFENFAKTEKLFTGIGIEKYYQLSLGANAGYKVHLLAYGIIGTFLVIIFYLSLLKKYISRNTIGLFIIYFLWYLQAAYPLWECNLILYITALPVLNIKKT